MYSALAAILWALYGSLLGYFGGRAFENRPLLAVAAAFGIAFVITTLVEGIRTLRARRTRA